MVKVIVHPFAADLHQDFIDDQVHQKFSRNGLLQNKKMCRKFCVDE